MNLSKRHEIFTRFKKANPHPSTELEYRTPFELLIAVMLSAQATDKSVNLATRKLFVKVNTPENFLVMGEIKLCDAIKNIGLYRTKARNILATCKLLILCHGSQVPRTKDHLESLPGVGRKTANVILNTVFNLPVIAVDTHVFRVANRTGIAVGKNVLEVEIKLIKFIPKEFHQNAHHWLILHGRYVCKAGKPECALCSINDLCDYKRNILKNNNSITPF
ncbi:endonuclease III [Nitrosomonadaceae bacterium]|jgi:endonuclease III|nr:endonuclease III [Nitrosospira sp.]MDW7642304.1 endonuclease III [Nitrosomonadaceae bacterium]MDW7653573.1 endonuclease III [Nitrosomonadaceae bacterium]MDW7663256.1 endonuclease III [Nitrosomonadaceae bacterium]MDW7665239.1 endonuclease III [Nitrosomonadaceae bacterium]